jgi:uncharacterized Zn-finger protein
MSDDDADKKLCTVCGGGKTVTCDVCGGLGQIDDPDHPGSYLPCPNGRNGQMKCPHCGGSGWEP